MSCNKSLVILAGGLGSRYKSLKQIDGITDNNSPILEYSIFDAIEAGFKKVVLILNKLIPEQYLDKLKSISSRNNIEITWVYQEITSHLPKDYDYTKRNKPWGTAHALLCVKDRIAEPFVIINADDFYGKEVYLTASKIIENREISNDQYHIIPYRLDTTISKNGSVSRGICEVNTDNFLQKIVERKEIYSDKNKIYFVENNVEINLPPESLASMNFSIFHPTIFNFLEDEFSKFLNKNPDPKDEFLIPDVVQNLIDKQGIKVKVTPSPSQWMGITYPEDKAILKEYLLQKMAEKKYPKQLWY